jgi:hypothetical protein
MMIHSDTLCTSMLCGGKLIREGLKPLAARARMILV